MPKVNIAIVDYEVGNHGSLVKSLQRVNSDIVVSVTRDPSTLSCANALILPGVGAFEVAQEALKNSGLHNLLTDLALEKKIPILGICLGLQLIAQSSSEYGFHTGLKLLDGEVRRLKQYDNIRLPHVGWNSISINPKSCILAGVTTEDLFYFDHSYAFYEEREMPVAATCTYGSQFVAALEWGNIMGVQFHPEISGASGAKVLRNFFKMATDIGQPSAV